jgi:fermentation-respiration switch protein FrsA (DUF1100 family)
MGIARSIPRGFHDFLTFWVHRVGAVREPPLQRDTINDYDATITTDLSQTSKRVVLEHACRRPNRSYAWPEDVEGKVMMPMSKTDYAILDRPEVVNAIFHPRAEWGALSSTEKENSHTIAVGDGVHIGARFHLAAPDGVNILFFHGNGEIVADYDDLGPLYNERGINFLAADYRGYGRSNGQPTVGTMMADSHIILEYVKHWLHTNAYGGPLVVMGRSLGSAPALELAAAHVDTIAGLIIESGFALATPLLRLLGVDVARIGFNEDKGFGNLDKIRRYNGPTLIIHAQHDHIIPFSDGQSLHDASGAAKKRLLRIDHADHNDIFYRGMDTYMQAIDDFARKL